MINKINSEIIKGPILTLPSKRVFLQNIAADTMYVHSQILWARLNLVIFIIKEQLILLRKILLSRSLFSCP